MKQQYNYSRLAWMFATLAALYLGLGLRLRFMLSTGMLIFFIVGGIALCAVTISYAKKAMEVNSKSTVIKKTAIGALVGIVIAWFIVPSILPSIGASSNPYEDVFDKHPSEWTDDEAEYVDGFFDWMDEQNDD